MKYLRYLNYLLRHKWFVFLTCCQYRLVWLGIVHDWSKFLPSEFIPYARHFYGNPGIREGRDESGYYKPTDTGDKAFDFAWMLHQKRNKHHWQWWVLPGDEGGSTVLEIPRSYLLEMLCDWMGAGRVQGTKGASYWYTKNRCKLQLHSATRAFVERILYCGLVTYNELLPTGDVYLKEPSARV